jgi:rhodanese-related sulfurtransferase
MTQPILAHLREHKVDVRLGDSTTAIAPASGPAGGLTVTLKSGATVDADLVILGVGVRPENMLATAAGLEVGPRGGVRVNPYLQTSDPNIYAVGDVIETISYVTGNPMQVPLAGPANRQGRIAADHIFGRDSRFRGAQGTAILRVFELTAALTGETEKSLTRAGRPFLATYVHPTQHASYYPGATPMTIKLLADPATGRILGGQAVGREGVDSRMNVLAMAIHARMTVFDLEQAELVYSPQFGSAKDAINMAGFVAANVIRGDVPQIHASELPALASASVPPYLLDVREPGEFAAGAIPGAVNVPLDDLRLGIEDLPRDRLIIAYCHAGQRGYIATRILAQLGFNVRNLAGGYKTYTMYAG